MVNIKTNWWKDQKGNLFDLTYILGDDSIDGYKPGETQTLEERTKNETDGIIKLLELEEGHSILDIPCGYGRHSIELSKKGINITGVDYSKSHIKKAVKDSHNLKNIKFDIGDMRKLNKSYYDKFDAVINMFYSFGFFNTDKENFQAMKQFYNVLTKGGKLLLHTDVCTEMINNKTTNTDQIRRLKHDNKLIIIEGYNKKNKRMQGSWEVTNKYGKDIASRSFYSVRIYSIPEYIDMAKECGFKWTNIYGSFQKDHFTKESKEMILLAEK
jgi:cyclopropane fatty-acyl-phospholipid synthase-like methyltransferase